MGQNRKIYYKGMDPNLLLALASKKKRHIPKNKRKRDFYKISFDSPFGKDASKNLIVMYDIPSSKTNERNWFRRQLISFGYVMIQRSVWVGPSPLPKEFITYVKNIGLEKELISFKLAQSYKNKKRGL